MLKKIIAALLFFGHCTVLLHAQGLDTNTNYTESDGQAADSGNESADVNKKNNMDLQMVYGQYNTMLSQVNFSQQGDNFAYLLTSVFKRSNDYGYGSKNYSNSSYSTDKIGFTGNVNSTQNMKNILDIAIDGGSFGMFNNSTYNREEKEKIVGSLKNIYKYSIKSEVYFTLSGTYYAHNLLARQDKDIVKSALSKYNGEVGGEYIWSASNRFRSKIIYSRYDYKYDFKSDENIQGEVIDDFYITNFFAFSLGVNTAYNRDIGFLGINDISKGKYAKNNEIPLNPIAGLSIKGLKYVTFSLEYRYDIQQFKPEEIYFEKKYLLPDYSLKPARIHKTDVKMDVRFGDNFTTKVAANVTKSDNFYNYCPAGGSTPGTPNVLSVNGTKMFFANLGVDSNLIFKEDVFDMNFIYKYSYFRSKERVTYKPMNNGQINTRYQSKYFIFLWQNSLYGKVYTSPNSDNSIKHAVVGTFDFQYKATSNIFANMRVENLYNEKYYLRDGYPESGIAFLFGLRILI
jgi:hypothetical protein